MEEECVFKKGLSTEKKEKRKRGFTVSSPEITQILLKVFILNTLSGDDANDDPPHDRERTNTPDDEKRVMV